MGERLTWAANGARISRREASASERSGRLEVQVSQRLPDYRYHNRMIPYASNSGSRLTIGICSTRAWAISNRSMDHDGETVE